jgi:hypothetical protein
MKLKNIVGMATAMALAMGAAPAFAKDVRDPGRIPKPDRPQDPNSGPAPVAQGAQKAKAGEQDTRDTGHPVSRPNDRDRDSIRRR